MPETILISVDLPAPLSPTRPSTWPAATSMSTRANACTAPKRLLMPCNSSNGVLAFTALRLLSGRSGWRFLHLTSPGVRSLHAGLLAGVGVGLRADLRGRPEAVLHYRVLDVRLGHGDR